MDAAGGGEVQRDSETEPKGGSLGRGSLGNQSLYNI